MKVILIGYGKMGKIIENILHKRNHTIITKINKLTPLNKVKSLLKYSDIAIDFSHCDIVVNNILTCFDYNIPIVVGTTGWNKYLNYIKKKCIVDKKSILYSTNFSLGCNIVMFINRIITKILNNYDQYNIYINEGHHKNKFDSPSGTSIVIAHDIINNINRKKNFYNKILTKNFFLKNIKTNKNKILINSIRDNHYIGYHEINYKSVNDIITLKHNVYNRYEFAYGAVISAEWLINKQGFFTMKDIIKL